LATDVQTHRADTAESDAAAAHSLTSVLLALAAAAVLVSAYIHYYLYFHGGYRGIHPDTVLGLNISRAFILNAVGGLVIAELLVLAIRWREVTVPAAVFGLLFGLSTLGAYLTARTVGLLGFDEHTTSTEAIIGGIAEVIAVATCSGILFRSRPRRS
jgi:hypothetical protein